jgi:hypothetical protein
LQDLIHIENVCNCFQFGKGWNCVVWYKASSITSRNKLAAKSVTCPITGSSQKFVKIYSNKSKDCGRRINCL